MAILFYVHLKLVGNVACTPRNIEHCKCRPEVKDTRSAIIDINNNNNIYICLCLQSLAHEFLLPHLHLLLEGAGYS